MNKLKKVLISGLVISAMAPSAFAKCPGNTYDTIINSNQKITTVQQLIDYLNRVYGTKITLPQATAAPQVTAAPQTTAVPQVTSTPKATAAPAATPKATANASAIELEVFNLVNQVRAQYGLSQLKWADDLATVARNHSQDMINRNFFSHTNPDGLSPFDRMKNYGISYRTAAENIAYGQRTPQAVMDAWMNSSGHRANILNASVKELGVGAATSANGTIYWTQEFVAR